MGSRKCSFPSIKIHRKPPGSWCVQKLSPDLKEGRLCNVKLGSTELLSTGPLTRHCLPPTQRAEGFPRKLRWDHRSPSRKALAHRQQTNRYCTPARVLSATPRGAGQGEREAPWAPVFLFTHVILAKGQEASKKAQQLLGFFLKL